MITRYFPPRKTPDLYSYELYNEICSNLGVKDEKQKKYFKETIERAAISFIENKRTNKKRLTDGQEKKEFLRLANSLNKTRKIFDDLFNKNQLAQFRFFGAMKLKKSREEEVIISARKEVFGENHNSYDAMSLALLALEKTALQATHNSYSFGKDNKTHLVLEWLWCFSDDWHEISKISFAKGNNYDSPSLRILQKMAAPINEKLDIADRISDSMLEQAVIEYLKYQKENPYEVTGDFE